MHDQPLFTFFCLLGALAGDQWQCHQCGQWFSSSTPSQTCGNC